MESNKFWAGLCYSQHIRAQQAVRNNPERLPQPETYLNVMCKGDRHRDGQHHRPQREYGNLCDMFRAQHARSNGMNNGQKAIHGHEDERVNGGIGGDHNQILNNPTPGGAKGPMERHIVHTGEWHTEYDKHEIGSCQIHNQQIRCRVHVLVEQNHQDDQQVAQESSDGDGAEKYGHQPTCDTSDFLNFGIERDEFIDCCIRRTVVDVAATAAVVVDVAFDDVAAAVKAADVDVAVKVAQVVDAADVAVVAAADVAAVQPAKVIQACIHFVVVFIIFHSVFLFVGSCVHFLLIFNWATLITFPIIVTQ